MRELCPDPRAPGQPGAAGGFIRRASEHSGSGHRELTAKQAESAAPSHEEMDLSLHSTGFQVQLWAAILHAE